MRRQQAQDGPLAGPVDNDPRGYSRQNDDVLDSNNRTTEVQTMMHILKTNIGTGVLAMPLAFKSVGPWLGLVLVPTICAICVHCMNILISSHNKLCDKFNYESLDYDQVAALGLACGPKWARRVSKRASVIVTTFLILLQVGLCCVYILFTAENLREASKNLFQLDYSLPIYLLAIFPIVALTSCTSNLKHLARVSTLANVIQLAGLAIIFFDLLQFHTYVNQEQEEQPEVGSALGNNSANVGGGDQAQQAPSAQPDIKVEQSVSSSDLLSGLPLFFATAVYALEGIGVVLPLVKEMQQPARISGLNGVLNTSMSMVALLDMAMGFFGYAKYGQTVASSITLNLPRTRLNELVRLAYAVAIGLSYSLQFYVLWSIVWPWIDETLFYAYRPRVSRNKLSILDELSASNHWTLSEALGGDRRTNLDMESGGGESSRGATCRVEGSRASEGATINQLTSTMADHNDGAIGNRQEAHLKSADKPTNLSRAKQLQPPGQQYRALVEGDDKTLAGVRSILTQPQQRQQQQEAASSDELPEVQWRPPPRSMRGKRKLVRYTVILLTVSFTYDPLTNATDARDKSAHLWHAYLDLHRLPDSTAADISNSIQHYDDSLTNPTQQRTQHFRPPHLDAPQVVAAALIPRLDLFISLIGALASSSLAIIFPAIIQLCTFWNGGRPAHNFQDGHPIDQCPEGCHNADEDREEAATDRPTEQQPETASQSCNCRQSRASSTELVEASLRPPLPDCRHCGSQRRRRWQNPITWHLFVLKNMFLMLFGLLGLITGTWVTLNQLNSS